MFVNMAQGIYYGSQKNYVASIGAVAKFFAGNQKAAEAARQKGHAVPLEIGPEAPLDEFRKYNRGIEEARSAVAGDPVAQGIPEVVSTLSPVEAMNQVLTRYTAEQLAYYVDRVWEEDRIPARKVLTDGVDTQQQAMSLDLRELTRQSIVALPPDDTGYWRHIVYAYLLECTNIVRVIQRVVDEWVHGERLPFATQATHMWLRVTEQLFFTDPQPSSIFSLTSNIRPDRAAIRRNAYYRLLGFDLPAGAPDGRPYPFVKADAANREFARAWEQLLYETWHAYENRRNQVGPNATDPTAIAELVREIREMLTARRNSGALAREEARAVIDLSWFHLTVLADTQVVENLTAQSTSPALRLKKIADRVGVPIHSKSDSFFQMAQPMANVLEAIETGSVDNDPTDVELLYLGNGTLAQSMRLIRNHWPVVTGRAIKGIDVRAMPPAPIPARTIGAPVRPSTAGRIPLSVLAEL